jgi:hypothetical protein
MQTINIYYLDSDPLRWHIRRKNYYHVEPKKRWIDLLIPAIGENLLPSFSFLPQPHLE